MRTAFIAVLTAVVAFACESDGTSGPTRYFLSPPPPAGSGDDRNNGETPATAWATLDRASAGTFAAGSKILNEVYNNHGTDKRPPAGFPSSALGAGGNGMTLLGLRQGKHVIAYNASHDNGGNAPCAPNGGGAMAL